MGLFDFIFKKRRKLNVSSELNTPPTNQIETPMECNPSPDTDTIITEALSSSLNNVLQSKNVILSEQQEEDYSIAIGEYPSETPSFCDMKIVSNTIPSTNGFALLNENEQKFFSSFYSALVNARYNPGLVRLTRLSSGTFNVDYVGLCYIGKIHLYIYPSTYAVIKSGNKRATKVFTTIEEAQDFINGNNLYQIQTRTPNQETYMQYSIGMSSSKELHNPSLQQCIDTIPRWIKYLNYCKRN